MGRIKRKRIKRVLVKGNTIAKTLFICTFSRDRSLNQTIEKIHKRKKYRCFYGKKEHIPKSHVLREGIKEILSKDIEEINRSVIRKAKENKLFRNGTIDNLVVVGIDGTETFRSAKRDWLGSYKLRVKTAEYVNNRKVEMEQEWHKQVNVFAQIIGKRPNIILGYENVTCNGEQNKQEYEPNVGIKLLNKIKYMYGTGIDVIVGDAIYLEEKFLKSVLKHGYNAVVRLKDNRKGIIEEAEGLFKFVKPIKFKNGKNNVKCWRESIEYKGIELQVLKFIENEEKTIYVVCTSKDMKEKTVNKIIHARWNIENNGFNELKQYWHLGHCFIAHSNGINVMLQFIVLSYNLWELYIYSHIHNFEERKISKIGFIDEIIEVINSLKYCDIWISSA